jgi:MFS family permease
MSRVREALRSAQASLRQALANDGIRRLGYSWTLGTAADGALAVVMLVTVFNREGVIAAGLFGAVTMVPAVVAGMFAGVILERFPGNRILVALGLIRAAAAALTAVVILTAGPTMVDHQKTMLMLFGLAAIAAVARAPVRPTQVTLMPALARSPGELVAANTAWTTGEGIGAFVGPFAAGILMGFGFPTVAAALAAVTFLITAAITAGLKFEQAGDASGGMTRKAGGLHLGAGLRALRRRPVLGWSMLGTYGQVLTRGLLNAMIVVATIQLLGMGQSGLGLLSAALGLGGLIGALLALSSSRSEQLVQTETAALIFWGLPIAIIGVFPFSTAALLAMIVIGVANATYDVALFTIFQRGCANEERAPVLSVLEAVIGLGAITGSLLAPVLLIVLGPRIALLVGGAILPVMALIIYWRVGHVGRITVVDEKLVDLLRRVPAFVELPLTAVERLAAGLVPIAAGPGTVLMTQGEPGDRFIVIASGEIEVSVDGRPIHRLGPGAGVGEIALLRRTPRTATVTAVNDVTGYSVDPVTFLAAIAGPAAAACTERMVQANLERTRAMATPAQASA